MNRLKKLISYKNLPPPVRQAVKQTYPEGYEDAIISVNQSQTGEIYYVIPLEWDDTTYLIKVKKKKLSKKLKSRKKWSGSEDYTADDSGSADYQVDLYTSGEFDFED